MVFKDQLIAISACFIYAMCRSSILKWQYFRNLIIIPFLNEYNHNEDSFVSELWKMLEAAIGRCPSEIDALPTPF